MLGPVEYLVIAFPGNQFNGEIVPALTELIKNNTIRILDLLFIKKDADGSNMAWMEQTALPAVEAQAFRDFTGEIYDLLNEEDITVLAEKLEPNSAAAVVVFEHTWAIRLRDAVVNSGGQLVDVARIPAPVAEAAMHAALAA
jgi:hypothetical protein